ncbi:hypothetical protein [Leptolinea tardivitalis]|uniref:Squalene cyclase C-terminal domain-containing protein n=1 Tax=Leptolinea tardivitalis TaxID=229920 RepID=A0A0P6WUF7_9CHLR|nr:hypothetical protein [Leptolinea tardivitalis]KPL70294.1 hypothetical protein ADM99_14120 [Leptolinea tardivitalis]GAP21853.1 hypothetical protein LTAR_02070 [Leptolinea tardivitalis]
MGISDHWLLGGPAYVQYRTRLDLLGLSASDPQVKSARAEMLRMPEVQNLVFSLQDWPGKVLSSHKSSNQSFHTLNFLADLGLTIEDPGMPPVIDKILATASPEGPFRLTMNIGASHGGHGIDTGAWALCDAPNLIYALIKMGLRYDPKVEKAASYLIHLVEDFGWPCGVSQELGSFHGPGKKTDPCPYATLVMLKVMGLDPIWRNDPAASAGVRALLKLWQERRNQHPYIFYMGTDFCKLKAPLIWYDIVHVLDVLSFFPAAIHDPRYQEMLQLVREKEQPEGCFIPESVYIPYREWDFGQKKQPSYWLTFLIQRIFHRSSLSISD